MFVTSILHPRRVFELVAETINSTVFTVFPATVLFSASSMYNFDRVTIYFTRIYFNAEYDMYWCSFLQEISTIGINLFFCLCSLTASLTFTFVLSYSGNSATLNLHHIGDIVYNSKWYEYPPSLRKNLILIMARSQNFSYFTGYQIIRCTLEVFMKVNSLFPSHIFHKMVYYFCILFFYE